MKTPQVVVPRTPGIWFHEWVSAPETNRICGMAECEETALSNLGLYASFCDKHYCVGESHFGGRCGNHPMRGALMCADHEASLACNRSGCINLKARHRGYCDEHTCIALTTGPTRRNGARCASPSLLTGQLCGLHASRTEQELFTVTLALAPESATSA